MMTVFKALMILCTVLGFLGSIAEKDQKARKTNVAIFAVAGTLFLLAEVATHFL